MPSIPPAKQTPKPKAPPKLTNYVVFQVTETGLLRVIDSGLKGEFPKEPRVFRARTPQEARDKAFAKLTAEQVPAEQDSYQAALVALAAGGWSFEEMAWKVERKVART